MLNKDARFSENLSVTVSDVIDCGYFPVLCQARGTEGMLFTLFGIFPTSFNIDCDER